MEKIAIRDQQTRVSFGVECLDSLLNGGIEAGIITEIFGEGGSGKTNLCMQIAINVASQGKKVYYLDSEGFSNERFAQMSGSSEHIYDNVMLFRISSLDDQEVSLIRTGKLLEKTKDPGILIIDSFTEFFRLETSGDYQARVEGFQRQIASMMSIAATYSIPVLITNQIYQDVSKGEIQPFGGFIIDHAVKAIIKIEKLPERKRKISVMKHRSIAEGSSSTFRITSFGLECA